MSGIRYPDGWRIELLCRSHNRAGFQSGQEQVDTWLKKSAFQSQKKHLSSTKVLLDADDKLVGYYTLATSQVDFSDLPNDVAKSLPPATATYCRLGLAGDCGFVPESRYRTTFARNSVERLL